MGVNMKKTPVIAFLSVLLLLSCAVEKPETVSEMAQVPKGTENQRTADMGNGYYLNPILGGDYPDPSILRVGDDYYMTHSSFDYYPGLLIWHSKDLVNWRPVTRALNTYVGSVAAPDFLKYGDTCYIYFPAGGTNWVISASSPEGPWSQPVDLKIPYIDPGHVTGPDNRRFLHLSDGNFVELAPDGLSAIGEARKIYEGWEFPKDWSVECFCLESPKLTVKDGYYYLTVAEGGTAGPATSHMVVSSRSTTPWGPWEHSPYNPIVHAENKKELWWSKGHGTLVDDIDGNWWIMYHGYENGFHTLGRQTLMEPVEWTDNGWFRIPENVSTNAPIKKPAGSGDVSGMALSDSFKGDRLGIQWSFFRDFEPERLTFTGNGLVLKAKGSSPGDCAPLLCIPANYAYEITVELELSGDVTGGLLLFYNSQAYCGLGINSEQLLSYMRGRAHVRQKNTVGTHAFLRVVNDSHEVSTYYSGDGVNWTKSDRSMDSSGYHHNTFGGFLSLRTGVFAAGSGTVTYRNFSYRGL